MSRDRTRRLLRRFRVVSVAALALAIGACSAPGPGAASTGSTRPGRSSDSTANVNGGTSIPPASAPAARVSGPVTGGKYGVPFNAMPKEVVESSGYSEEEYFIDGDARSFAAQGELGTDGRWTVRPNDTTAPYKLRILARRPSDAARFNGTVLVEWLNVSAGMDADPDFGFAHPELLRSGYAYVAVSAQTAGVVGGAGMLPIPNFDPPALTEVDPQRYGSLVHPGDDYSYDIFAQVSAALRRPNGVDPLRGLSPQRIIAAGESQSAGRMATFVNAVQPVTHAYDGFLIHSRGGAATPINTTDATKPPRNPLVRTDLAQPVLQVITETDLFFLGFYNVRQPDTTTLRTWEIAGTAHVDQSVLDYGLASGARSVPDVNVDFAGVCGVMNSGPQRYVVRKAIDALNTWIKDGTEPAKSTPLDVRDGAIVRDEHGNARGGIRTPAVDVPIATLSGDTNASDHVFCKAFGSTTPFKADVLRSLYPSHDDYVERTRTATSAAVAAGFILPADKAIIDQQAADAPIPS